jgi:CheY-like chemotaxis protein
MATTGADGLARARAGGIDAIVLDLLLPDLDGFEVAAALRSDPTTSDIPIVVVTGHTLDEMAKARLNEHALDVLAKGDEAVASLREWLGGVTAQAA